MSPAWATTVSWGVVERRWVGHDAGPFDGIDGQHLGSDSGIREVGQGFPEVLHGSTPHREVEFLDIGVPPVEDEVVPRHMEGMRLGIAQRLSDLDSSCAPKLDTSTLHPFIYHPASALSPPTKSRSTCEYCHCLLAVHSGGKLDEIEPHP